MSREQWGHGYWSGVRDERNGIIPHEFDIEALSIHAAEQLRKLDDGMNVEVRRALIIFCFFGGMDESIFKEIYEYILTHPGIGGCRISGGLKQSYKDDVFIFE